MQLNSGSFRLGLLLAVFVGGLVFIPGFSVLANKLDNVSFPVAELGNCADKNSCKTFCDKKENRLACLSFAEQKGLITKHEAEKGKKMAKLPEMKGPGGCDSEETCQSYCDNVSRMKECLTFAKANDLLEPGELEEVEGVLKAMDNGAKMPGNCTSKDNCQKYCEADGHLQECVEFGQKAGFIKEEEAAMIRKTGGKGPGGCRGKEACDNYCQNPENTASCLKFGMENDLMPPAEKENAQKVLMALEKGVKMPKCQGRDQCDSYCQEPEHMEECMAFAEAAGFIKPEEAEQARQIGQLGVTSGPGGCQSKEECKSYCDDQANQETCLNFSVKSGMMTESAAEKTKEMMKREVRSGPGGCQSESECHAFCQDPDNLKTCQEYGSPSGRQKPEEQGDESAASQKPRDRTMAGPGGCQSPEECAKFCSDSDNLQACSDFGRGQGKRPGLNRPDFVAPGGKAEEAKEKTEFNDDGQTDRETDLNSGQDQSPRPLPPVGDMPNDFRDKVMMEPKPYLGDGSKPEFMGPYPNPETNSFPDKKNLPGFPPPSHNSDLGAPSPEIMDQVKREYDNQVGGQYPLNPNFPPPQPSSGQSQPDLNPVEGQN